MLRECSLVLITLTRQSERTSSPSARYQEECRFSLGGRPTSVGDGGRNQVFSRYVRISQVGIYSYDGPNWTVCPEPVWTEKIQDLDHGSRIQGSQSSIQDLFPEATLLTANRHLEIFEVHPMAVKPVESLQDDNLSLDGSAIRVSMRADDLAVILFTSGSSGRAKAVEFTSVQLRASVVAKQKFHNTNRMTRFLSWVSLDHSANFWFVVEFWVLTIVTNSYTQRVAPTRHIQCF